MPTKPQASLPLAGDVVAERRELADYQPPVAAERSLRAPGEQVTNVGNLLQLAIQSGIGADQLEKLVHLQEHVLAKQAKDEFFRAMAGFHAECPVIGKNRKASIRTKSGGEYGYQYADLAMVADTIKPLCEKWGFSYSFKQEYDAKLVKTICVVRHECGHSEETCFNGPWESDAGMSAMQKAVAATTTARRMALVLAFGLSVGEDLDGRGALPDEHPQPERSQETPRTAPRGQRVKPSVTYDQVAALWESFFVRNSGIREDDRNPRFMRWVHEASGREFDVWKKLKGEPLMLEWTPDDLAKCHAELRAAEGG